MKEILKEVFKIRGHTLLCLHGFRGKGYSEDFVANLEGIHEALFNNPEREVEVVVGPDDICEACPHLQEEGCTLDGVGSDIDVIRKDNKVSELLGIDPGKKYSWEELLRRISKRINPAVLKDLCGKCPWYPRGYCEEGIICLKERSRLGR